MARAVPRVLKDAIRVDEAEQAYLDAQAKARRADLDLAAELACIKDHRHYSFTNAASIGEYAERHGDSEYYVRRMINVHIAVSLSPVLKEHFLAGRVSHDAVVAVGQLLRTPRLVLDGEDWIGAAVRLPTAGLIDLVRRRRAEARTGAPTVPLTVYLAPEEKKDFLRAKKLVSRSKRRPVTEAETVLELVRFYRKQKDPLMQAEGTRRVPDTTNLPGRSVPGSVRRELARRSEDRCQVPTCRNEPFVDAAHRTPHSQGGCREASNLCLLCRVHHIFFDYGLMRVTGPSDNPTFFDREGHIIGGVDPPKPEAA